MNLRNSFILLCIFLYVNNLYSQNIMNSIYDFQVKTIEGDVFEMSDLKCMST